MRRIDKTWTMAAADDNAVCLSQKPTQAGNLTLNGVLAATETDTSVLPSVTRTVAKLDVYRPILITSDGDDSGLTFIITGTNHVGTVFTETLAGPNKTAVQSLNPFDKIISIHVDGAAAGNLIVGTSDEAYTPPIRISRYAPSFELGVQIQLSSAASLKWQWQYTLSNPESGDSDADKLWTAFGNNHSASAVDSLSEFPHSLIRGYITDYVSGSVKYSVVKTQ